MTDQLKKTRMRKKLEESVKREMQATGVSDRVLNGIKTANNLLRDAINGFNALRGQLASCCSVIQQQDALARQYAIMAKDLAKGDFELLLEEESSLPPTFEVEDASEFAKTVCEISSRKRYDSRMADCLHVFRQLISATERWKSKEEKMRSVSVENGASEDESKVAEKKIVQLRETVNILQQRTEVIRELFLESKEKLESYINRMNNRFKSIETYGSGTEDSL